MVHAPCAWPNQVAPETGGRRNLYSDCFRFAQSRPCSRLAANESALKIGDWSPVQAFPAKKHAEAGFPIYNAGKNSAFFRLSWEDISLPDQLAWISPGRFQIGCPEDEPGRFMDEGPTLKAVVPHGFWMDRYEVTQKNYLNLMGKNPSNTEFSTDMPVNRVTWHDAVEYCIRMTDSKGSAGLLPKGYVYRLPTEAEWEYACRAGTKGAYSFVDSVDKHSEYGWWAGIDGDQPEPMSKLKPNPWGL